MVWDYSRLRGKIKEVCGTQEVAAEKIGVSKTSLSLRLNNQAEFSQDEMFKACDVLGISAGDISLYFFTEKV